MKRPKKKSKPTRDDFDVTVPALGAYSTQVSAAEYAVERRARGGKVKEVWACVCRLQTVGSGLHDMIANIYLDDKQLDKLIRALRQYRRAKKPHWHNTPIT